LKKIAKPRPEGRAQEMMRVWATATLCGLIASSALAQSVQMFGLGTTNCAYWLSTPSRKSEGSAWLLGYWSALNTVNEKNHLVGKDADGKAIIAEVKKICAAEPSTSMVDAIARVYYRFSQQRTSQL
jgi:hypothetical protein